MQWPLPMRSHACTPCTLAITIDLTMLPARMRHVVLYNSPSICALRQPLVQLASLELHSAPGFSNIKVDLQTALAAADRVTVKADGCIETLGRAARGLLELWRPASASTAACRLLDDLRASGVQHLLLMSSPVRYSGLQHVIVSLDPQ